jgi:D-arginine dehydrogenase
MVGVEVVVVGGGMAGVSVGYELAGGRSVVVVEGERTLGMHATGRSAAVFDPNFGPPLVRVLTAASRGRLEDLRHEFGLPPILARRPGLWVAFDVLGEKALDQFIADTTAREIRAAEAVALCPVLRDSLLRAALDEELMDIDVMALHQGYVRGLKARGGRVVTGAPVSAISARGDQWVVQVGAERIVADVVVNAAGAWVDRVAALAGVPGIGIQPMRRTIAVASGSKKVDSGWPFVAEAADRFYFRTEATNVLISPADRTLCEPTDARPDELDVALALERVNEATTLGLRRVHTAWAGLRSFAPDGNPVVGAWPEHPNFVFFAGQGGYGIQMAPALAEFGAAVCTNQAPPADINVLPEDLLPRRV